MERLIIRVYKDRQKNTDKYISVRDYNDLLKVTLLTKNKHYTLHPHPSPLSFQ